MTLQKPDLRWQTIIWDMIFNNPFFFLLFAEVEQTGASSEFYDKFTIRYHISIILKSMWESNVHKIAIVNESKSGKQFVKFINMLMNDTTFLLDESMDALKRIHEVQNELDDHKTWAEQSQETQQTRLRNLSQDERQCRSYLTLVIFFKHFFLFPTCMRSLIYTCR